ncbi:hypothetical protein NEI02_02225 [Brachyspira pilosicoli]|uniref:Uncharacterized protein n=1 Tax=Brachyspira pilosicoli TaxID=52584 RepID=A0AAJ6G8T2_BRAPL|nr:hypothetical protein [Brachyspira pilosicoli]WIH90787.1 hypothetical protein NEI02_02225 [Brachyspira pilosicoli]WIH93078.1 hypothetical protein NEI01_02225 [Brachyspira pilosicoli]WIH95367.1 hypothetical protein NEH99_02220 [Brachyspira pilosicoli]
MQILISIIINVIILAVVMPLFYVYIVSRARERLEKEVIKKARDEIEALVKEFNNIALSRISLLEDAITRANNLNKQLNEKDPQFSQLKEKKEAALNANIKMKYDVSALDEKNILDIKVEDDKKDITEENEKKNKESLNNNNILDITIEKTEKIEKENKQIEENNVKETIKEDNNSKKEEIKISRYDEIRKIKENSKKEAIEKLRKQLDMTIRNNITLNRNNNSEDNSSANDYNSDEKIKHENILKLHKEGLSNKEIAAKLKCSLTEVDIIIELNNN